MMMFSLLLQSNRSKKWFKWLVQPPTHDPNPPSPRPTVIGFKSPTPLHWLHALDEDHGEDLHHFYFHRHNACHHQQRHIFKFLHYLDILFGSNLCASLWMPKKLPVYLSHTSFSASRISQPKNRPAPQMAGKVRSPKPEVHWGKREDIWKKHFSKNQPVPYIKPIKVSIM